MRVPRLFVSFFIFNVVFFFFFFFSFFFSSSRFSNSARTRAKPSSTSSSSSISSPSSSQTTTNILSSCPNTSTLVSPNNSYSSKYTFTSFPRKYSFLHNFMDTKSRTRSHPFSSVMNFSPFRIPFAISTRIRGATLVVIIAPPYSPPL